MEETKVFRYLQDFFSDFNGSKTHWFEVIQGMEIPTEDISFLIPKLTELGYDILQTRSLPNPIPMGKVLGEFNNYDLKNLPNITPEMLIDPYQEWIFYKKGEEL